MNVDEKIEMLESDFKDFYEEAELDQLKAMLGET